LYRSCLQVLSAFSFPEAGLTAKKRKKLAPVMGRDDRVVRNDLFKKIAFFFPEFDHAGRKYDIAVVYPANIEYQTMILAYFTLKTQGALRSFIMFI
jgi:hypothetical protein